MAIRKKSGVSPDHLNDIDVVFHGNLSDSDLVKTNIEHPDVDFVLRFRKERKGFILNEEKYLAVEKFSGDSLIDVIVPDFKYSNPSDPDYSDVFLSETGIGKVVEQIKNRLPEQYLNGEPFGIAVFCYDDLSGKLHNVDSDWTQGESGRNVFNALRDSGLNISSIIVEPQPESFVNEFAFAAKENGCRVLYSSNKEFHLSFAPTKETSHARAQKAMKDNRQFSKVVKGKDYSLHR